MLTKSLIASFVVGAAATVMADALPDNAKGALERNEPVTPAQIGEFVNRTFGPSSAMTRRPRPTPTPTPGPTTVSIQGEKFFINDVRTFAGGKLDGTLPNSRMVQATFDDANPATVGNWKYPNGRLYSPTRQTNEFVAALPSYRANGLRAVTLNFQGGNPISGSSTQPWDNTAFNSDGSLKAAYLARMDLAIRALDAQGMVAIVGYFYFGQDGRLSDETAVRNAVTNATQWVLSQGYRNVMIEIDNEADSPSYHHAILQPARVSELISTVQTQSANFGRRLYVSTSMTGGVIPPGNITQVGDFILLHGNGQSSSTITAMVNTVRARGTNKPIIFNEDSTSISNFQAATDAHASWGYFDAGANNYVDGFQSPPTNWGINTIAKQNFFNLLASLAASTPSSTPTPTPTSTPGPTATPPTSGLAQILSPPPGSTFSSSSVTFSWSAGNARAYELTLGTSPGDADIYDSGGGHDTSVTVNNIPTNGITIYVRLYSRISKQWPFIDYTYKAL